MCWYILIAVIQGGSDLQYVLLQRPPQSKWLQLSSAECRALDQIWFVLFKTLLCGSFPHKAGVKFCYSCLAAHFFLPAPQLKICNPLECKEPQYSKPTSPDLLCSALAQAWEAGSWPGVITGCLWPMESSWGPLLCEFVHPWECGPCCAANGAYPRCPSPPRLPQELGYYVFWYQISSAFPLTTQQEGCAVGGANQKEHNAQ